MGNVGNRMIQYLIARSIAARVGEVRYSAVDLRDFGIVHPPAEGSFPSTEVVTGQTVELDRLARALACGALQRVDIRTYGQRLCNFLPAQAYRKDFLVADPPEPAAGAGELLINIRQGDILDGHHPDYVLTPIAFIESVIDETGLSPVFLGQLEQSPYMTALRSRFPTARYLPSQGPATDFYRIRQCQHILPAISTFSWLAAWLSSAERIYQPVLGLMHPLQNRGVNLLPLDDPRYRFYYFPVHYAAPVDHFQAAHRAIDGLWRYLPADAVAKLVAREPPPRDRAAYLDAFDEAFYLAVHPDIAQAIALGNLPSGRYHYETCGFDEGRAGFALDRAWYCRNYPIAAIELSLGDYLDADQHWLSIGRSRGYRRGIEQKTGRPSPATGVRRPARKAEKQLASNLA
jgi:hypothetical protein